MIIPSNLANNNTFNISMPASNFPSSCSTTILPSVVKEPSEEATESQIFLTEEGVQDIIEKAMKKQRVDLKIFRQSDY